MEISGILCNSDFTWNQILSFLEFKVAILAISDALQTNFKASAHWGYSGYRGDEMTPKNCCYPDLDYPWANQNLIK